MDLSQFTGGEEIHERQSRPLPRQVLIIKAKGGLGNRMLSAITGLVYAELSGRTPIIDWRDGIYGPLGVNAYPLLFETTLDLDPAAFDTVEDVVPKVWRGQMDSDPTALVHAIDPAKHGSSTFYRRLSVDLRRLNHPETAAVFWSYLPKVQRLGPHLRRHPRYRGRSVPSIMADVLGTHFRPKAHIIEAVERFLAPLPRPVVGVHVRYTDRKMPIEPFLASAERQLAGTGGSLFLATDSAHVERVFQNRFGDVHVIPKFLPEDGARLHSRAIDLDKTREAENALIDMWALSKCDHLVYSKNSTFSLSSALFGDLPASRQTDVDRWNPSIVAKRLIQPYL